VSRVRESQEEAMATEAAQTVVPAQSDSPSVEFVEAVSELLQTDATDLLAEMGYYESSDAPEEMVVGDPR
jgi:hypothetical protein